MYKIQDVSSMDLAFGCNALNLMPSYEAIPDEFKYGNTKWNKLFSDWFYFGIVNLHTTPKEDVNSSKALRHIETIMGSFEPQHEHKEAGVAYLFNEWFEDITWGRKEP